jgi:hypothetical protein
MTDEPGRRAAQWLAEVYDGRVELAGQQPIAEQTRNWLFACRYADAQAEPMLAATLAVPKSGEAPFPVATSDPLDESVNVPDAQESWRRRCNARNCLVATDAALRQQPASALPWRPEDEAPGWWERLVATLAPEAELTTCATWAEVADLVKAGGPGTHAAIWLQRQHDGVPITGHLLYAQYADGSAVLLDGQRGTLARLEDAEVGRLLVARFAPAGTGAAGSSEVPWERSAQDFETAVAKANAWLDRAYAGAAVLVDPTPADETRRGWLFACTTRRFRDGGDWRDQMLDAAVVVPKAGGEEPFGLPNSDPWNWMTQWDEGASDLADPPAAGDPDWFNTTMDQLGSVISASAHDGWAGAMQEIVNFPDDARALVWVRRRDGHGRETVGNLLVVASEGDNVRVVDGMAEGGQPTFEANATGVHVIRYR